MLSPKLMIARSAASEEQWKETYAELLEENDADYIEKVRYKPSEVGATNAIPPVLKEQKDRRRYEISGRGGKEKELVVRFMGEFIGSRIEEAARFVGMVAEAAQVQLQMEETDMLSVQYQWKELVDAQYRWNRDVRLRCNTKEEVLRIFMAVEGKTIDVPGGGRLQSKSSRMRPL